MRLLVLTLTILVAGASSATRADDHPQGHDRVLDRLVGEWHVRAVFKRAAWTPEEKTLTETQTYARVLGGKFVEGKIRSDEHEARAFYLYDEEKKAYKCWLFHSGGFASEYVGTWDAKQQTMTWKSDPANGVDASMEVHFESPDKHRLTFVARNADGELLMNILAEHTRANK
jgi:hypothetical protein